MRFNVLQFLTYASLAASSLVMPLFAQELGADTGMIGLIGAAYGLASFFSHTLFGRAGDRMDRRVLLLVGFFASALAFAAQTWARTPESLLVARFVAGFAIGIVPPALAAYVYDIRRPLGLFTSYNAFGWMAASLLVVAVGYLATHSLRSPTLEGVRSIVVDRIGDFETLFLLSAAFCLVGAFLVRKVPPMRLGLDVPLFPVDVLRRGLHVYVSVFIRHFGAAAIWTIYPLYIFELGGDLALVGWVHIVNMVSQILVFRNVERLRRIGSARWLVAIGLGLSALTFYSFTLAETALQLLPLQIPLGVSFACLWLGSMKEVMEHSVERATATGLLNASMSLSNVIGPLAGGFIAVAVSFRATMVFGALVTALALALFFVLLRSAPAPGAPLPLQAAGPSGDVAP